MAPLLDGRSREIERDVRAHVARERKTAFRRADREDAGGAGEPRERDGAEAHGPGALDYDGVAEPHFCPFDHVHSGQQSAATADVIVKRDRVWQLRERDTRL